MANLYHRLFSADFDRPFLDELGPDGAVDRLTYGELDDRSRRMGQALLDLGLAPGDRVVAQTTKSSSSFALWLGCLAAGIVHVPANTAYTAPEIDYFCSDAAAGLLIVDDPETRQAVPVRTISLGELVALADQVLPVRVAEVEAHDPCALVYTSGTTGRPKGATLSHRSVADNASALVDTWQFHPDDIVVHSLPIYHLHGLYVALHPAMAVGARVRFLPAFDPDAVIRELGGATVFMGIPTYYHRILANDRFGPADCATIRLFTSGSAPMTELTHGEFSRRTGHTIVERYGMSEAGIIASNRIGDVVTGSVGHALASYELRVVDSSGQPVEPGATGTVEIRGPSLCLGYWRRPDADAETRSPDGWFSTGDVGHLDPSDRLTLEGRSSDMIISGGLNVYPKEVELVLDEIDGVVESAVVGIPHADFGEAVTAYLVLEDGVTLEHLQLDSALGSLARFKHPKSVHRIDALPRNAMSKVQKVQLRSMPTR